jgi:protein-tyrosine phosphatase
MAVNDSRIAWAKQLRDYLHPIAKRDAFRPPVSLIEDGLFLSSKPQLDFPKVDAVLNVSDKEYAEPEVTPPSDNTRSSGYFWLPLFDRAPFPGVKWLELAVEIVGHCRENNWTILVHCDAGMSRSAMVVVAYLMKRDSLTVDQALDKVLKKRSIAPNEYFLVGLMDWEDFLNSDVEQAKKAVNDQAQQ